MRVSIADRSLSQYGIFHVFELEIDKSLQISDIIRKVKEKGVRGELVYGGKQLSSLSDRLPGDLNIYKGATIHIIANAQGSSRSDQYQEDDFGDEPKYDLNYHLVKYGHYSVSFSTEKQAAEEYEFDYKPHIMNPVEHFNRLAALEDYVFANSELHFSEGIYEPENDSFDFFGHVDVPFHMLPQSNLACDIWNKAKYPASAPAGSSPLSQVQDGHAGLEQMFLSFMKSYLILSRLIKTLDTLVIQRFASSYFTFLMERPGGAIAQLVAVDLVSLDELHHTIEGVVTLLSDRQSATMQKDILDERIRESLLPVLVSFLNSIIGNPPWISENSGALVLQRLCRITVLLCDLALLSYVGSHASRFDHRFTLDTTDDLYFVTQSQLDGVFSFRCDLRRLTCLDELFDSRPVWVFQLNLVDGCEMNEDPMPLEPRLSVLTTIERLADVWGPVHAISNAKDEKQIIQYVLGTGVIRRSKVTDGISHENAIKCHWENLSGVGNKPTSYINFSGDLLSPDSFLSLDDLLLIGAETFLQNPTCTYSQIAFQQDYVKQIYPRGTKRSEWKTGGRSTNFGLSKIVTLGGSVSQKLHPQIPLKDSIWKEWTLTPKTADPLLLQTNYGVEVSNCTGNAKRVPLKSFIQGKTLWSLIELQFPGWKEESWGLALLQALSESDAKRAEPLREFWKKYKGDREKVADLVSYVLGLLADSGTAGSNFRALLVAEYDAGVVSIPSKLNDWAFILDNTWLTATYAVVTPSCMIYPRTNTTVFSGIPCSKCAQQSNAGSHTILHIQSSDYIMPSTAFLRLQPSGVLFEIHKDTTQKDLMMLKRASASSFPRSSTVQDLRENKFSHKRISVKDIYIWSRGKSYGGMRLPRSASKPMISGTWQQQPWNFNNITDTEELQDEDDSDGSVWSGNDNSASARPMGNWATAARPESQQLTLDSVKRARYYSPTTETSQSEVSFANGADSGFTAAIFASMQTLPVTKPSPKVPRRLRRIETRIPEGGTRV